MSLFLPSECSGENDTMCTVDGVNACLRDSRCNKDRQCDTGVDEDGCGMYRKGS